MLAVLARSDGTRGHERAAAEAVLALAVDRWPHVAWQVDPVGEPDGPCAQLVGAAGERAGRADLLLYSHLDTSFTGDPAVDAVVTGHPAGAAPYRVDRAARTVRGPGLGVARAPAAAALVGFARATARLHERGLPFGARLLLAARGTHRAAGWEPADPPADPTGVTSFLARHGRPGAAIVAKGGPAGVLHDEPGACYLRVRARGGWGAIMARDRLHPEGGLLAHAGVLVAAVERAGAALAAAAPPGPQSGGQFGIGAIRSGLPDKPDLAPAVLDVYCYLVAPGTLTPGVPARTLTDHLQRELAGSVLAGVELTVTDQVIDSGATTDPDADVVRAAVRAYGEVFGVPPAPITGWTGSTDGVTLRAAGVPTARVGPSRTVPCGDGSDVVELGELVACTRLYENLVLSLGNPTMSHLT